MSEHEHQVCSACGSDKDLRKIKLRYGKRTEEIHVCPECAALWGIGEEHTGLTLHLGDFYMPLGMEDELDVECPVCGRSLSDIRLSGRAGCAECYNVFTMEFRRLISGAEGGYSHQGRIPRSLEQLRKIIKHQALRREGLHRAIEAEDYEEAARLRDLEEPEDGN